MSELFTELIERIRTDADLAPDTIEKLIADCVLNKTQALLQEIIDSDAVPLKRAIANRFGLQCVVSPSIGLYVKVAANPEPDPTANFSTEPLDNALTEIAEKDFSQMTEEQVITAISNVMNNGAMHILQAIMVPNAALRKLFVKFHATFGKSIILIEDPPFTLKAGAKTAHGDAPDYGRGTLYL